MPANPPYHVLMFLVARVTDNLQETLISACAAAVFGRAGSLPRQATGVFLPFLPHQDSLKEYLVLPAIAEIVLVLSRNAWLLEVSDKIYFPSGQGRRLSLIGIIRWNADLREGFLMFAFDSE